MSTWADYDCIHHLMLTLFHERQQPYSLSQLMHGICMLQMTVELKQAVGDNGKTKVYTHIAVVGSTTTRKGLWRFWLHCCDLLLSTDAWCWSLIILVGKLWVVLPSHCPPLLAPSQLSIGSMDAKWHALIETVCKLLGAWTTVQKGWF